MRRDARGPKCERLPRAVVLACSVWLAACDQFARIGVEQAPLLDGSPPMREPDAAIMLDAMVTLDAMTTLPDATVVADGSVIDAGEDSGACEVPAVIEICNPLDNTGCAAEIGTQCDVDLLATTPQGTCVFSAPNPNPDGCLNVLPTLTCPPRYTCLDTVACAKICLCDSHCDAGQCCTTPVGVGGFKACAPC